MSRCASQWHRFHRLSPHFTRHFSSLGGTTFTPSPSPLLSYLNTSPHEITSADWPTLRQLLTRSHMFWIDDFTSSFTASHPSATLSAELKTRTHFMLIKTT